MNELKECIDIMKPGDSFLPLENCHVRMEMDDAGIILDSVTQKPIPISKYTLDIKGKILKAKGEILTPVEIVNKFYNTAYLPKFNAMRCAQEGIKNGKLHEWNRMGGLRDGVKEYTKMLSITGVSDSAKIMDVLKNLTPPE
jgi:hypothetical protein